MAAKFLRVYPNGAKAANPKKARRSAFEKSQVEVRMFHVKDGEAILLVFPQRWAWLIDGGSSTSTNQNRILGEQLAKYLKDRQLLLQALVPSHPHKDHVGAVAFLLQKKPKLASKLSYYYTGDAPWNDTSVDWLNTLNNELSLLGSKVDRVILSNAHREVVIADNLKAHLFAGSGEGKYTSVFVHLRYGDASLLFTGDAYCRYELELLQHYGEEDFRADLLKVTHHGSSGGTAKKLVAAVKPGIAIASTADDEGHFLEADTLGRLGGRPGPRAIFETLVDGDIILRTDGKPYGNGILYQVEFESPGLFASDLGATTRPLSYVDGRRSSSNKYPECT